MEKLFTLTPDPDGELQIEEWLAGEPQVLYTIARHWFSKFRDCGEDIEIQLHDGMPTACINEAAVGYVNVFKAHVNVGFFTGAFLDDPQGLLEGSGKRMRHVKLRPGEAIDESALERLISDACRDIRERL